MYAMRIGRSILMLLINVGCDRHPALSGVYRVSDQCDEMLLRPVDAAPITWTQPAGLPL